MIYTKYNGTDGFERVTIIGFTNGSVECNYRLRFAAGKSKDSILQSVKHNKWAKEKVSLPGYKTVGIDQSKTNTKWQIDLEKAKNSRICDLQDNCNEYQICKEGDKSNYPFICNSKCTYDLCGDYGLCLLHPSGNTRCICLPDTVFEHYSDSCLKSSDLTNILVVTAGLGGAVIIVIVVVIVCVCKKRRTTKKTHSSTRHNRDYGSEISMPTRMENLRANRAYNIGTGDRGPPRREHMVWSSENERPAAYYNGWERISDQPVVPSRMYLPIEISNPPRDYHTSAAHEHRRPKYVEPGDSYRLLDTENQLYIRRPRLSTRHSDMFGYQERFV
ncbi:interphotoreceptor matrix proteoglycan 2-like [Mizuhopecten yessoensis]|uniref:interphotoreceptor matrix proteoglycan 2-like n=1 Tax=Mizuhopecten yessoensis TaxID=6573 RepID=UPI000B45D7DE|nr:interphotoreceptor matrix proteoglycan 2-like [Mizuhopecten yessoensis]